MLNECSYVNVDVRCPIYDVLLTVNNAGNFKKYHSLGLNQPKFSFKAIIEHGTHCKEVCWGNDYFSLLTLKQTGKLVNFPTEHAREYMYLKVLAFWLKTRKKFITQS